jgi:hypothetical protein
MNEVLKVQTYELQAGVFEYMQISGYSFHNSSGEKSDKTGLLVA